MCRLSRAYSILVLERSIVPFCVLWTVRGSERERESCHIAVSLLRNVLSSAERLVVVSVWGARAYRLAVLSPGEGIRLACVHIYPCLSGYIFEVSCVFVASRELTHVLTLPGMHGLVSEVRFSCLF